MPNIDERYLKPDMYEYLKIQKNKHPIRAVGVITDKQLVLYSQIDKNDHMPHDEIAEKIYREMYPDESIMIEDRYLLLKEFDTDNVVISAVGRHVLIELPRNKTFSSTQEKFVNYFFNQIDKYNKEIKNEEELVKVCTFGRSLDGNAYCYETSTLNEIIDFYETQVTNNKKIIHNESVIGKQLDELIHLQNYNDLNINGRAI